MIVYNNVLNIAGCALQSTPSLPIFTTTIDPRDCTMTLAAICDKRARSKTMSMARWFVPVEHGCLIVLTISERDACAILLPPLRHRVLISADREMPFVKRAGRRDKDLGSSESAELRRGRIHNALRT